MPADESMPAQPQAAQGWGQQHVQANAQQQPQSDNRNPNFEQSWKMPPNFPGFGQPQAQQ